MAPETPSRQLSWTIHARIAVEQREIEQEWIERAIFESADQRDDPNDRTKRHAFVTIPEFGGRTLHVVYNVKVNPVRVISAYFDRSQRRADA